MSIRPTRILMIADTVFPDGSGATVRIREYVRGWHALGLDVRVLLAITLRPADWPDTGAPARGDWRGVPYESMGGVAHGVDGWVRRRIVEIRGIRRMFAAILRAGREPDPTAAVVMGESVRFLLPVVVACRLARIPVVHHRSEAPFVYARFRDSGPLKRLWQKLYVANVFRLFDGVMVISTYLEDYIRPRVRRGAWVIRVPILVDADTFACAGQPEPGLVGYAGSLGHPEELEQLVEAVSIVRRRHPETRARIVGGGSEREMRSVRDHAAQHGVEDAVELTGFARPDEMPALLCRCAALALPRAEGLFSTAGMPTKLGEYLATGRPVVVTATGDIPLYLHDGVDAFVTPPGDVTAFAQGLERALYDPASRDVAAAGQLLARREFDPVTHMRRLIETVGSGATSRPS